MLEKFFQKNFFNKILIKKNLQPNEFKPIMGEGDKKEKYPGEKGIIKNIKNKKKLFFFFNLNP